MPIKYVRRLSGRKRSRDANRHLGFSLAFVAGATNAGGFLAVQQYTSHMTGVVSSMADHLVLGSHELVLNGVGGLLSFLSGAMCSAMMVNYARRRRMHSEFALPLLLEAVLLLCFGVLGARLAQIEGLFVPLTVMLLCFIMGLQNAMVTKISQAEVRTTHMTGVITDLGIELGKLFYWNGTGLPPESHVRANRARLRLFAALLGMFTAGGVIGAAGFKYIGFGWVVPFAVVLLTLSLPPLLSDLRQFGRREPYRPAPPARQP